MTTRPKALTIGPLRGGGLVLGYRCSSRCRHCLYACGPHRRDGGGTAADLEAVLDRLAQQAPHARLHIGGGEPFLNLPLLAHAVAGMERRGLILEYVETNAAWAKDRTHAEAVLGGLADQGLSCVLVSLSPFHAEFVALERTLAVVAAARRVLPGGAFVWISDFLDDLRSEPAGTARDPGAPLDLDALLAQRGERYGRALASRYGLVPAGRAGRYLHRQGARRPWRDVAREATCAARLADTSHFHVDLAGAYVPGLCAGLVLPLADVPGRVDLDRYPVLAALHQGGPLALVELAQGRGFQPAETYSAACDLCTQVRRFLRDEGFTELGPPGFYDDRSWA